LIWISETVLYGLMIGNFFMVLAALIWAWRTGQFVDLEATAALALGGLTPDALEAAATPPSGETL
jgi:nitrogen fixation-related uncharacterized protein